MNSYSENLHSSVLASLESQEVNQKKLESQLNSSIFTLYYAEGAEIVTNNKLESATNEYNQAQAVKEEAVKNKNISTNIVLSATLQNTNTTQSVTNGAVSAANIQVATNAIVRLASDMGSIFSIINAADYGTQIYQQSIEAYNFMNRTAYLAEVASQYAMEASAAIAEVSSSTVQDKAKATDSSINNLLQVSNTNFATTAAVVAADNEAKAAASVNTKAAQGTIESNKIELGAAKVAYLLNNKRLNYNLRVDIPKVFDNSYDVSFDYYRAPFNSNEKGSNTPPLGLDSPVKSYNLFLVKDSKKSVFSASAAEELMGNALQHIQIIPLSRLTPPEGTSNTNLLESQTIVSNYQAYLTAATNLRISKQKTTEAKDNLNKANTVLVSVTKEKTNADTAVTNARNNAAKLNKELESARHNANQAAIKAKKDPEDKELAAAATQASKTLKKAEQAHEIARLDEIKAIDLAKVNADNLKIATVNAANAKTELADAEKVTATDQQELENAEKDLKTKKEGFKTIKILDLMDTDNEMLMLGEKYVIFLFIEFTDEYKKGINTYDDFLSAPSETFSLTKTLKAVKNINIVQKSEKNDTTNPGLPILSPYGINFTADKDDEKITEYRCMFLPYNEDSFTKHDLECFEESIQVSVITAEINSLKTEIIQYKNELQSIQGKTTELSRELNSIDSSENQKINDETIRIKKAKNDYDTVENEINSRIETAQKKLEHFNIGLEKILSRKIADIKNSKSVFFTLKLAENVHSGNYTVAVPSKNLSTYEVKIDAVTTDNFGNPLIDSKSYVPVILSYYNGTETNKKQYNNSLSDWENEESFTFSVININKY